MLSEVREIDGVLRIRNTSVGRRRVEKDVSIAWRQHAYDVVHYLTSCAGIYWERVSLCRQCCVEASGPTSIQSDGWANHSVLCRGNSKHGGRGPKYSKSTDETALRARVFAVIS